jgi:hypothetical protein
MEGADGRDELLDWEALYLRLPQNLTWNSTEWDPGWNVTAVPNATWDASAPFDSPAALIRAAGKAIILGLLILATVVGTYFFTIFLNIYYYYNIYKRME